MKQVSLRLEDNIHTQLTNIAAETNLSLQQQIVKSICSMRDIYQTNHNGRIQLRVNLTYLGDLLVLGRIKSFNGVYVMMEDALSNNEQVIIEKHWEDALPQPIKIFETDKDLEKWRDDINRGSSTTLFSPDNKNHQTP